MGNIDIPINMVTVTTTITKGDDSYTTSITVQTHKTTEIQQALDMAWAATRKEALRDAAAAV